MSDSEARAAWLAGLKVGDTVLAHQRYTPDRRVQVVFIDHTRIFYGSAECPDWVWRESGHALNHTSSHRKIEPPE